MTVQSATYQWYVSVSLRTHFLNHELSAAADCCDGGVHIRCDVSKGPLFFGEAGDTECIEIDKPGVGFSDALDWRPLLFVEPVIAERACAVCGVLCRKAVRLWCAHTVCSDCYVECVERGGTCPLDQEPFCEDDLDRLECSAGYVMKRREGSPEMNAVTAYGTLSCKVVLTVEQLKMCQERMIKESSV
ncbi:hypothetical protein IscW_ISCW012714 [Ixodes scapularis]|uniref:RING-type domain-containing protein n=1 Tax=Ixodes scapularis TaxID=6945 RepID=B7QD46_IXOSC|nr:hypothetical protein IscW_ISCW012714 [Ixodes scapularis]|eukprot:XP_002413460.1 hypothetical protein IscW_ISCW012714 [Ixodes scapularis]